MKRFLLAALAAACLCIGAAGAQPTGIALATYEGADRNQKLLEGARKEGELTIYTSAPTDDMKVLADAFEKKYGIKAKVWRASSEKVLQRGLAEARANRFEADVFDTNGPEMEALVKEKILAPVRSPVHDDLIPEARFAHQSWAGSRLNVFALAYNTKAVKKSDLPATYEALLDPRWKGKLGIEAEDVDWFATVSHQLGEAKAKKLFKDIVAKNGVSVRKGHSLLTNLVASGEVPLALTVYLYKAEQLKAKGAPIDWFTLPPAAIARTNGVGVAAKAPHPHAALLWYDFELSEEGQKILYEREYIPTNRKIDTRFPKLALRFVDNKAMLDSGGRWDKAFAETFLPHGSGKER
jgi:iron(III) transport system substrate-binding protein